MRTVSLILDDQLLHALDSLAAEQGIPRTALINNVLTAAVAERHAQRAPDHGELDLRLAELALNGASAGYAADHAIYAQCEQEHC